MSVPLVHLIHDPQQAYLPMVSVCDAPLSLVGDYIVPAKTLEDVQKMAYGRPIVALLRQMVPHTNHVLTWDVMVYRGETVRQYASAVRWLAVFPTFLNVLKAHVLLTSEVEKSLSLWVYYMASTYGEDLEDAVGHNPNTLDNVTNWVRKINRK